VAAIRSALARVSISALAVAVMFAAGGAASSAGGSMAGQLPIAPSPVRPRLTPTDWKYYGLAWRANVVHDHACDGSRGAMFTTGSPSHALSSHFKILRQPATPASQLPVLRHHDLRPQQLNGGEVVYNQELYINGIRLARSAFGASFYVIPAGNAGIQRDVPGRCGPEQVAALRRMVSRMPRRERTRILAAQARFLAYLRYVALHSEGICASYFPRGARELDLTSNLPTCATLADLRQRSILVDASVYLDHAAVFWTVVPDGVGEVTLRFGPRGPRQRRADTTTVRPINNVVVAREPFRAPGQSGFPSTIVLRGADGRTIKKIAVTPDIPTIGYGC
jgi:hypothetical protein